MTTLLICIGMIIAVSIFSESRILVKDNKIKKQKEAIIYLNKLVEELSFAGNDLIDDYLVFVQIVEDNFGKDNVDKMFIETKDKMKKDNNLNEYLNSLVKEYKENA